MITLEKPSAQAQNNISSSPLWDELPDESAASCAGGNYQTMVFATGGKYFYFRVPASWPPQQVYKAANYLISKEVPRQRRVDFIGVI
jgi:hypothetical protein